jgi:cell division septum initiation protein DivIVA
MFAEPEFWVAVGFVILMGVFVYVGVHRTVLTALDHRSQRIKTELDDARSLKEDAAKLLAEYKARHAAAEREAQDIITSAKAEAERIAAEAKSKIEGCGQRRGRGGLHDPVAIGQRRRRRRSVDQRDRGSSRQAELTNTSFENALAGAIISRRLFCWVIPLEPM